MVSAVSVKWDKKRTVAVQSKAMNRGAASVNESLYTRPTMFLPLDATATAAYRAS